MNYIQKSAGSQVYNPALDGLRALAVLGVLVSHFGLGKFLDPLSQAAPWGHMGVRLFFVLSGYLITSILIDCRERVNSKTEKARRTLYIFYMRRFLRILPLYYLTIVIMYLFGDSAFKEVWHMHAAFLSNTSGAVYAGAKGTGNLIDPNSAHFWSLSVEEQFYLCWPFLIILLEKRTLILTTAGLILLAPLFRAGLFVAGYAQDVGYLPTCTDALGIGAIIAFQRNGWLPALSDRKKTILSIGAGIVSVTLLLLRAEGIFYRPFLIIFPACEAILFGLLINHLVCCESSKIGSVLSKPIPVFIGKISFGIYLLHAICADFTVKYIFNYQTSLLQFVVSTMVTVVVCSFVYFIFERPINSLKKHFSYSITASRKEIVAPA